MKCAVVRSAIDVSCFHFSKIFEHLRRFSMPVFSPFVARRATPQVSKTRNPFKEVFGRRLFCEIASIADGSPCFWPRDFDARQVSRKAAKTQSRRRRRKTGDDGDEQEMVGMQTKETAQ
jgi:hypothetical protein